MTRGNSPWQALATAEINWAGGTTPKSVQYDDFYYSSVNGVEEGQYIFLEGNGLPGRWASHAHPSFCIVETGFGTGLNFLLTWKLWRAQPEPRPRLHFLSIEKYPLNKEDVRKALANWPELEELAVALLDNYPQPIPGQHRVVLEDGKVILDLWWEEAEHALAELAGQKCTMVDAWYLDGFSPNRNQSMWTETLFSSMVESCREGATFATFTAAGFVRRALMERGFVVSKLPGYGKKRECLHGVYSNTTQARKAFPAKQETNTPWDIRSYSPGYPRTAIVIGAGIAGCTAAAALARRNIDVTVLEGSTVANAGSGNDQGVLYTRLSHKHSPLTDFSLQSYSFAHRFYRQYLASGILREGIDGALCGSFHQSDKLEELATMAPLLQSVPDLAQVLTATEANQILGIEQTEGGYWYPGSGWMRPSSVCHALLENDKIQVMENTGAISLEQTDGRWSALSAGKILAEAECAVIAAGTTSGSLAGLDWLPLKAIRGQTTTLPSNGELSSLRAALCHKGYISPARLESHCIGATFDIGDMDTHTRKVDHRYNLDSLATAVPAWKNTLAALDEQQLDGRVGYRCASPDYLPLIGPVPNHAVFLQNYALLRKNAKRTIPLHGDYMPGLYLSTGHGSRGLTSTGLAAEIIASLICGEPIPLSRELYRAVSPGRFIIRDLCRKQL